MENTSHEIANFSKNNQLSSGDMAQAVENVVDTIIGLSKNVAENNAAKYQAQANVLIEKLKCKMIEEVIESQNYGSIRQTQEETFRTMVTQFNSMYFKLVQEGMKENLSDVQRNFLFHIQSEWRINMENCFNDLQKDILQEQACHREKIKENNKGIFGFLKRK